MPKTNGFLVFSIETVDSLVSKIQAGKIVGEITKALGGNGGGKPQMAQGMGKTQNGIEDILLKVEQDVLNSL